MKRVSNNNGARRKNTSSSSARGRPNFTVVSGGGQNSQSSSSASSSPGRPSNRGMRSGKKSSNYNDGSSTSRRKLPSGSSASGIAEEDTSMSGMDLGSYDVMISGLVRLPLNDEKVLDDLLLFLQSKCSIPITFGARKLVSGSRLKVSVASLEMKNALLSLSGNRFRRERLVISSVAGESASSSNSVTLAKEALNKKLEAFLSTSFDSSQSLLTLDEINTKLEGGFVLNNRRNAVSLLECIGKQAWSSSVTSLSMANCGLQSLRFFNGLWNNLPSVIRLNLSNNEIRGFGDIFPASSGIVQESQSLHKNLIHLILVGNPLYKNYVTPVVSALNPAALAEKLQIYYCEIVKKCPAIQIIDDRHISPEERVLISQQSLDELRGKLEEHSRAIYSPPVNSLGPFFDQEETANVVYGFLEKFFTCYDKQRISLLDAYHETSSLLSVSLASLPSISSIPSSVKHLDYVYRVSNLVPWENSPLRDWKTRFPNMGKFQVGKGKPSLVELEPYKDYIRSSEATIFKGSRDILQHLCQLPITEHVKSSFIIDSFQFSKVPGLSTLYLYVNGEFEESISVPGRHSSGKDDGKSSSGSDNKVVRSFGRNFILIPNTANPANGWPVSIVNDSLTIYNFASPNLDRTICYEKDKKKTYLSYNVTPTELASLLSNPNGELVIKFSRATGLNAKYAEDCLSDNKLNENASFRAFNLLLEQRKFPVDAFIRPQ